MKATIRKGEPCTLIVPPRFQSLMTGCVGVEIASGNRCCATYEDGTREYGIVADPCRDNFFALVGQVQAAARRTA